MVGMVEKKNSFFSLVWKSLRFYVKTEENHIRVCHANSLLQSLSGNKIRKFQYFIQTLPSKDHQPVVFMSYGGLQSNSMFAISLLASQQKSACEFLYFVRNYPKYLQTNPIGNLERSLKNNMTIIELNPELYKSLERIPKSLHAFPIEEFLKFLPPDIHHRKILWIPQGGALPEAEFGIKELCWQIFEDIQSFPDQSQSWKIFVASGTGTTALFMARCLSSLLPISKCEVIAIPCVGTKEDLFGQMRSLSSITSHSSTSKIYPTILPLPSTYRTTPFAQPAQRHLEIWSSLNESAQKVDPTIPFFDLIYAPKAFELMEESYRHYRQSKELMSGENDEFSSLWERYEEKSCQLLYYHCGGAEGNDSQLLRYHRSLLRLT
jgi:1-aminocyclopropane-1-carboxylate deaminase/D-cysteine desulfhydrase-like pyridoxal-dependent ACC family enzyme